MKITYRALTGRQLQRARQVRIQSLFALVGIGAVLAVSLYIRGLPYGMRPAGWPWAPADWYGVEAGALLAGALLAGACLVFVQKMLHIDVLVRQKSKRIVMFALLMTVLSLALFIGGAIILARVGTVSWTASKEGWRPGWVWSTPLRSDVPIRHVRFSADSQCMRAWFQGAECAWLLGKGKELSTANASAPGSVSLSSADFVQQGKRLTAGDAEVSATGSHYLSLRLKDGTQRHLATDPFSPVTCLALGASGDRVLAGSRDGSVRFWDIASGKEPKVLKSDSPVSVVAFTPDEHFAASGHDDGMIRLWNLTSGNKLYDLKGHGTPVTILAFDGPGRRFCSMASRSSLLCCWDVESDKLHKKIDTPFHDATHLALSPEGRYVIVVAQASLHVLRLAGP